MNRGIFTCDFKKVMPICEYFVTSLTRTLVRVTIVSSNPLQGGVELDYLSETIKLLGKLSERELKIIYYTVKTIVEGVGRN